MLQRLVDLKEAGYPGFCVPTIDYKRSIFICALLAVLRCICHKTSLWCFATNADITLVRFQCPFLKYEQNTGV